MQTREETMIYTFGYARRDSMPLLTRLVERLPVKVVDIRLSSYSRFLPEFRHGPLRERFGDRYLHVPDLGNLNYRDHTLPIVIANCERGLRVVLDLLLENWSVCLLCACSRVEKCHRLVVANMLVETCPLFGVQHLSGAGLRLPPQASQLSSSVAV